MASSIQLLRSTNAQERPFPNNLLEGQPALNLNSTEPGLFFKATDGSLVKVGPAAITADGSPPNASATGLAGNTVGEMWLDKSVVPPVLKIYDGAAWIDAGSGSGGGGGSNVSLLRWTKTATGGETSLSGPDDSGQQLAYTPGLEQVFLNGVLLERGTDYTGTNGTAFSDLAALAAGDVVMALIYSPLSVAIIPDGSITNEKLANNTISSAKIDEISSSKLVYARPEAGVTSRTVQDRLSDTVSVKDFGAVGDGVTDDTMAIQTAINSGASAVYFPPGTYITGSGNTQIFLTSDQTLYGEQGQSFVKAHSEFSTSAVSEGTYHFLLYANNESKIVLNGISFLLNSVNNSQSKLGFKNCNDIKVQDCYFQENNTWDLLFNNCSNFDVTGCEFECGVSGVFTGVAMRICNKSQNFRINNNIFRGSLVTKNQSGGGVQPSGDKWGSSLLVIDNGPENHINSNGFKGGKGRFITLGIGADQSVSIPGLDAENWEATVMQPFPTMGLSSVSQRQAIATISASTITFSNLPAGPPLEYEYQYVYWGTTPRDGLITGCYFSGATYSHISIINGIRINTSGCYFEHCGDVSWDPEGTIDCTCTGSIFYDCATPGLVIGRGTVFASNSIRKSSAAISVDCRGGGAYQALAQQGEDFANEPYEGQAITVSAPVGNLQTITSTSGFTHLFVNEWIRIVISGTAYGFKVVTKASNGSIVVDNTTARFDTLAEPSSVGTPVVIPSGSYTAGQWKKSPYAVAMYGLLQGDSVISGNTIQDATVAIYGEYPVRLSIIGNTVSNTFRAIEISDATDLNITGGVYSGRIYIKDSSGFQMSGISLSMSEQRGLILDNVQLFDVGNITQRDGDILGNVGAPAIVYGNCSYGAIHDVLMSLQDGDALNGQPTVVEGVYDNATNTVNTSIKNNQYVDTYAIRSFKSGSLLPDIVSTFAGNSTTPSVSLGQIFKTSNSIATTITNFSDGFVGKKFILKAEDPNTTIQHGASIFLKGGVNKVLANGEAISFLMINTGVWSEV